MTTKATETLTARAEEIGRMIAEDRVLREGLPASTPWTGFEDDDWADLRERGADDSEIDNELDAIAARAYRARLTR